MLVLLKVITDTFVGRNLALISCIGVGQMLSTNGRSRGMLHRPSLPSEEDDPSRIIQWAVRHWFTPRTWPTLAQRRLCSRIRPHEGRKQPACRVACQRQGGDLSCVIRLLP